MPDVDVLLQPPARRFYDDASEVDQSHLDRALDYLCSDPYPDEQVKFVLPAVPATMHRQLFVYLFDGRFVIIYHFLNAMTLSVLTISHNWSVFDEGDIPSVGPI